MRLEEGLATTTSSLASERAGEVAGLYVHIPFCVVRCSYCDFYSQVGADGLMPAYVAALVGDISSFPQRAGYRPEISSIFLGGGTPSMVDSDAIGETLDACRLSFPVIDGAEITLEANPESLTTGKLEAYRRFGVNRLSIGVQSLRDEFLELMGRPHGAREAVEALDRAAEAGFENLSADFIYGLPGQSAASWREDLRRIAALPLQHVSAYALETDKDTPLARDMAAGRVSEPEADVLSEQWGATCEILQASGFRRYEVSNFARRERECRHNIGYWTDQPYLGFGASAHGYWMGKRTAVLKSGVDYITAVGRGEETMVTIDPPAPQRRLAEAIITGLRLAEGCDFSLLSRRYGVDLFERYADVLDEEVREGRLQVEGEKVRLTVSGVLFSNSVLCRFV